MHCQLSLAPNYFHHPKRQRCAHWTGTPISSLPPLLALTCVLSDPTDLPVLDTSCKLNQTGVTWCVCLLSLSMMSLRSIHVVTCYQHIPFYGPLYDYTTGFIHSSGSGHLGHFCLLAVVNSAAMNICELSVWIPTFNSYGYYLGCKLLSHGVILCLTLWGIAELFL